MNENRLNLARLKMTAKSLSDNVSDPPYSGGLLSWNHSQNRICHQLHEKLLQIVRGTGQDVQVYRYGSRLKSYAFVIFATPLDSCSTRSFFGRFYAHNMS